MAKLTPRDVHIGAVLGGVSIGLVLVGLGVIALSAAYNSGGDGDELIDLVEGATFFASGIVFVLVSGFVLPALRAMHLETSARP